MNQVPLFCKIDIVSKLLPNTYYYNHRSMKFPLPRQGSLLQRMMVNKETHNWSKYRERVPSCKWASVHVSLWKREQTDSQSHRSWGAAVNLSLGHDRAIVLIQLQQLWLTTQDLNKIKPSSVLHKTRERSTRPHLSQGSYWQLVVEREGESVLFTGMAPGRLLIFPADIPTYIHIGQP